MRTDYSVREVHVCYLSTAQATRHIQSALLSQLPEDEQTRAARFRLSQDQLAFAAGRLLVRKMLSDFASAPAGGWRFVQNVYGKPALLSPPQTPDLHFNLSHCAGLVVAAVAPKCKVGIDAESLHGAVDPMEVARTCFSPEEIRYLESLPEARRRASFFKLWTLKEAYLKARGTGFAVAPSQSTVAFERLAICGFSEHEEQSHEWHFWTDQPCPTYTVAMAAQRRPGEQLVCSPKRVDLRDLLS